MRTLTPTLLAAQKSASAAPYLKVVVSDRIGGIRRLAFSRLYTGAEPDGYHAAVCAGDGSLVRARVAGGRVYYQRVANPGSGSDFSSWTDLAAAANAGVALCADGARVLLFFVDPGGTLVKIRESTDNGATLGAAVTAAAAAGAVTWLAADVKSSGDAAVLYSVGATVYAARRAAGVWGAPAAWTNSAASIAGLACHHTGDWNTVVCGADSAGRSFVWTAVFGDGFAQAAGTWSALRELERASPGSNVTYRTPFLARPDTNRVSFVEKFTGNVAYSRPQHTYSPASVDFAFNLWREPLPFNLASDFGLALAFTPGAAWLSTPSGVWNASLALVSLDVTPDVLSCEATDVPFGGALRLVLGNDDGRYSSLPAAIKLGAEVRVSPGYVTTAGPEASDSLTYWVDAIEHRTGGGKSALVLSARNAWGLLASWRARRQFAWAAGEKNVFGILQHLFARAGLEFSGSGASADAAALFPAFTVHPGESALTAVHRLLDMVPDVIFLRGEVALLHEPLSSGASAYEYGVTHPVLSARFTNARAAANRAQVHGAGLFGERFDWPAVEAVHDRLAVALDANLTTQAAVEDRADAMLRRAALEATSDEVTIPVNCGQELYDIVDVTDAGSGLAAAKRRVLGLSLRYSATEAPVYVNGLLLGAP